MAVARPSGNASGSAVTNLLLFSKLLRRKERGVQVGLRVRQDAGSDLRSARAQRIMTATGSGSEAALRAYYAIRLGDWTPSGTHMGETSGTGERA